MRAWGLALGLIRNGIETTIAMHESFPQVRRQHEGVNLCNWSLQGDLVHLVNSFDSVIVSYCQGDLSTAVAQGIADHVQLILDAYVPIYVEVSARDSKNLASEYTAYMEEVQRWDIALARGDYLLCANETQKTFYVGVLSALGRLNPITYRQPLIGIVPFGIEDKLVEITEQPFKGSVVDEDAFVILWFGGLYPWFDIGELIQAVEDLNNHNPKIKLLIVGGKNPFNPNPDFFRQYDATVEYCDAHHLRDRVVYFVDWVDFNKRVNWFATADIIVSLNKAGDENRFSWRTRVMDFVWGEVPIVTNGGDPLSEYLVEHDAAVRLESTNHEGLVKTLGELAQNPDRLQRLRQHIKNVKPSFYWHTITRNLARIIEDGDRAQDLTEGLALLKTRSSSSGQSPTHWRRRVSRRLGHTLPYRVLRGIYRFPRFIKNYGKRAAARQAYYMFKNIVRQARRERQYVFISHPLDQSGGPLAMVEMLHEFAEHTRPRQIRLIAPFIDLTNLRLLRRLGINIEQIDGRIGRGAVWSRLNLHPDDFVLINTSAISQNYRDAVLALLEQGRLKQVVWYVHEDKPALQFPDKVIVERIKPLLADGRLIIGVPCAKMQNHYEDFFGTPVDVIELHVDVDEEYKKVRAISDFDTIRFLLSGTATDGRKGQPTALMAFYRFYVEHYQKHPDKYRGFELHLIGLGDDYMSSQLITLGQATLGEHFKYEAKFTRSDALAYTAKCNATLCCSLMEAFGLYIAEGMYMGHFILRNDCSGVDEQLEDGVNGFHIESEDLEKFSATIERTLNKSTTSNEDLQAMGVASQRKIAPYARNSYYEQIVKMLDRKA